eukprot:6182058-Pleurochrysis_carterae.AAC.1
MLDIDYLGEGNNPDGLPGLYDQVLRILGAWYVNARTLGGERGRKLQCTAASSQFTTLMKFLKRSLGFACHACFRGFAFSFALCSESRDPDGAGDHTRVAGLSHVDSSCISPRTHFTRDRSRRTHSLHLVARLCSRERERDIKVLGLATPDTSFKNLKPHHQSGSSPAPTFKRSTSQKRWPASCILTLSHYGAYLLHENGHMSHDKSHPTLVARPYSVQMLWASSCVQAIADAQSRICSHFVLAANDCLHNLAARHVAGRTRDNGFAKHIRLDSGLTVTRRGENS